MNIIIGVVVGLISLMILVTAHEFGHFIMARRNGVKVLEFGICFPPRLIAWVKDKETGKWKKLPKKDWNKKQDGLIFSLNLLPIGGFCQMDGETAVDKRKGTFGNASFKNKTKILFGGVAMNWLIAFVIFTILAWTGMPNFIENQFTIDSDVTYTYSPVEVAVVAENSPAYRADIKAGDKIIKVGDTEVKTTDDIYKYNNENAGKEVTYTVKRGEEEKILNTVLNQKDNEYGYLLGITMSSSSTAKSTWSAPIVGAGMTVQLTGETFKGVGEMIWNFISGVVKQLSFNQNTRKNGQKSISEVRDSVSGPVGIIGILFPSFTAAGANSLAFLVALISVSLACMNVLPIPALDGGRWLLIAIYKLMKKELTKEKEEKIVSRAFIVLLAIMVIVTILDIIRFF